MGYEMEMEAHAEAMQYGTYRQEDIALAVGGYRMLRVFPSSHEDYRLWVLGGDEGSVTMCDQGNGWMSIMYVHDMEPSREERFWMRLEGKAR